VREPKIGPVVTVWGEDSGWSNRHLLNAGEDGWERRIGGCLSHQSLRRHDPDQVPRTAPAKRSVAGRVSALREPFGATLSVSQPLVGAPLGGGNLPEAGVGCQSEVLVKLSRGGATLRIESHRRTRLASFNFSVWATAWLAEQQYERGLDCVRRARIETEFTAPRVTIAASLLSYYR